MWFYGLWFRGGVFSPQLYPLSIQQNRDSVDIPVCHLQSGLSAVMGSQRETLIFVIKGSNSQILFCSTAIRSHSPAKPVLIFVSSRRQTRLTALDLIAFLATEDDPKQWLKMDEREVESFHLPYLCFASILLTFV